jgi:UDP-glucuronate 4-epimerase
MFPNHYEFLKKNNCMHILVTGGAGFIGNHVILELVRRGDTVTTIDNVNSYYDPVLKRARLARLGGVVEVIEIDIADRDAVNAVFKTYSFDAVCHLAAQAGVRYSLENPYVYADTNYRGTLNILEAAKRYRTPHVVMASSSSVYGLNTKMPFNENDRVDTPISIYAASKRATELLAHSYTHLYGMNITVMRPFTVYGPWGRPDMALFLFTEAILKEKPIQVFNGGVMQRDFTYIDDIVSGFVAAVKKQEGFQIYNVGNGNPVSLMDFIHAIENVLGKQAVLDMQPMQPGDVPATWADISKAQQNLGYSPKTSVQEGVKNFVAWYREYYKV